MSEAGRRPTRPLGYAEGGYTYVSRVLQPFIGFIVTFS